jgi:hypothetical protein
MATRRTHRHSHETEREERPETHPSAQEELSSSEEANGAAGTSQEVRVSPTPPEKEPVMQRAEAMADRLGERITHYAALIGFKIMQFAARAREEAEDIWAEAQSIRRGKQPPQKDEG